MLNRKRTLSHFGKFYRVLISAEIGMSCYLFRGFFRFGRSRRGRRRGHNLPSRSSRSYICDLHGDLFTRLCATNKDNETFNTCHSFSSFASVDYPDLVFLPNFNRFNTRLCSLLGFLIASTSSRLVTRRAFVPIETASLAPAPITQTCCPSLEQKPTFYAYQCLGMEIDSISDTPCKV